MIIYLAATATAAVILAAAVACCAETTAAAEDDDENEDDPDTRVITAHNLLHSAVRAYGILKSRFRLPASPRRYFGEVMLGFSPGRHRVFRRLKYTMPVYPKLLPGLK